MYELTSTVKTHTGHAQVRTRQNPSIENGKEKPIPLLTRKAFAIDNCWEGEISLF